MDVKDWISLVALAVSLWSLYTAQQNAKWTKRAKGAELRAELLILSADISWKLSECQQMVGRVRAYAECKEDFGLYKQSEILDRMASLRAMFEDGRKALEDTKPAEGLQAYERGRHILEEARKAADEVYASCVSLRAKISKVSPADLPGER